MTTTVCDMESRVLTTDSRWSWQTDRAILYVDDVGFEKMLYADGAVYQFAGNSAVIQQWKDFMSTQPGSSTDRPTLDGISLVVYDLNNHAVVLAHNCFHIGEPGQIPRSIFSGTGMVHALPAWTLHRCAYQAIDHAVSMDPFSGGPTKFFETNERQHNLMDVIRVGDINRALPSKGYVMTKPNVETKLGEPVSASEAAANDPAIKELVDKIAQGQMAPSAPFMFMLHKASAEQNMTADNALNAFFATKR
jgi:hypothetical protein